MIEKQCHSDVITKLDVSISHKRCFKNVLPWKHEQSDFAQIGTKAQLTISKKRFSETTVGNVQVDKADSY